MVLNKSYLNLYKGVTIHVLYAIFQNQHIKLVALDFIDNSSVVI